jgi:uncharacterized protein (DUF1697 family)
MDHLRSLFEALGLANVETFIASGNVIFDSRTKNAELLERRIEKHLKEMLGYEVATFIRTIDELNQVANHKPFSEAELNAEGNILYVGFVRVEPDQQAKAGLTALANEVNGFQVRGREMFWLRRTKAGESEYAGGLFEKKLGQPMTFRNVTTVRKLAAKF